MLDYVEYLADLLIAAELEQRVKIVEKLNYAANQLIHTDSSILDICLDVGFSNLSYFYRIFQEEYGLSPAKFRHQYQSTKIDTKFE